MKTEETQFISLAAAAKMTNYSQDYISLLCRQGKLKAEKLGRNWVTTKDWVYEYIDKTEGKGASVVPVRIKEADKPENKSGKVAERRPLFGSTVLEMATFCTVSVILLANTIGFSNGIKEVDRNFNIVQSFIAYQNYMMSQAAEGRSDEETLTSVADVDAQICGSEVANSIELLSFDKETDANAIAEVTKKIEASLTEPATIEVYKTFAIVSYQSDSAKKSLYMIKK